GLFDFFDQGDAIESGGAVYGLGHVVEREAGDGDGGERFHLDAGAGGGAGGGDESESIGGGALEVDGDLFERQRVTEGNEFITALGGLDAGDAGDGERFALGQVAGEKSIERGA